MNKALQVIPIPALQDNYIWLVHFQGEQECFVVDPGVAEPILDYIHQNHLKLTAILITHHHWDHTNGIIQLVKQFPSTAVFGPMHESIKHKTHALEEGGSCVLLNQQYHLKSYAVPGHTKGHIAYYSDTLLNQFSLFSGDTLFSGGCGRLFEDTPHQLYHSLMRLRDLPDQTQIYCGHEYTIKNLLFAKWLEPDNVKVLKVLKESENKRAASKATLPSSVGIEKMINPFLRCDDVNFIKTIQQRFSVQTQTPVSTFTFIRTLKDQWSPSEVSL